MFLQVISILLAIMFIFASSIKLTGWHKKIFTIQLDFFKKYGLNRQVMFLVGLVELSSALMLPFQGTIFTLLGAVGICATSLGALFCHLKFDTFKDGIPATITLALSSILIYANAQLAYQYL